MRTFLISLLLISGSLFNIHAQKTELKFNPDGKFKILQLTDVHYIYGKPEAQIALDNIDAVLAAEKPDFIVITGDIIYGKPARESMQTVMEHVSKAGKPFVALFGNHDDENGLSRKELLEIIRSYPLSLNTTVEGIHGVTNQVLTLKNKDGKPEMAFFCFDSNAYSAIKGVKGYDIIRFDQIEWYRRQSEQFKADNGGVPLPALAFFHIPFPEYAQAASDERKPLIGSRTEYVTCPALNSGLFTSMKEMGDVIATFVGHDHDNDYVTVFQGMLLGYGRYSGANTVYNHLKPNGCRVIELTKGEEGLKTWIRLRDGRIINEVAFPEDFAR
ncbi:MAG: metallophosphoesterase family protein [Dysgonamonadaceae bacterium]|jgi:DNA repair exonuclease SbcCD nuclease subunit|nr:metallophosphoesterase family protein [Dysgonamonadaceae bacterium]